MMVTASVMFLVLLGLMALCTEASMSKLLIRGEPTIFQQIDQSLDKSWILFKKTHHKNYKDNNEDLERRLIWEDNVKKIQEHNLRYDLGLRSYTMGVNEYSDLTFEEYKKYLLGARPPKVRKHNATRIFKKSNANLPETVDWRTKGYVTPIKNQGQCGSCWAFSSVGALEGQHFKSTGQLVSLSEQNLVDCVTGDAGCNGGWMDIAFAYVESNGGIDTENSYPYEGRDGACRYRADTEGATDYGFVDIARGDEEALEAAAAEFGPISVAIDAAHAGFMNYRSGVYYEPTCSNITSDHAVLVVGYGNYEGLDYWLVKNSWGTSWGMNGYIMMARNQKNNCAIATYAAVPLTYP